MSPWTRFGPGTQVPPSGKGDGRRLSGRPRLQVMATGMLHVDGRPVARVEIADTPRSRGRGLLGRDGLDGALWLRPCRHVHGLRMRFDLDVAHVGRDGTVLAVAELRRNRFGRIVRGTRSIVEAERGAFSRWGLVAGVTLSVSQ